MKGFIMYFREKYTRKTDFLLSLLSMKSELMRLIPINDMISSFAVMKIHIKTVE